MDEASVGTPLVESVPTLDADPSPKPLKTGKYAFFRKLDPDTRRVLLALYYDKLLLRYRRRARRLNVEPPATVPLHLTVMFNGVQSLHTYFEILPSGRLTVSLDTGVVNFTGLPGDYPGISNAQCSVDTRVVVTN